MNEEISHVLQMLEAGKISADEAERLIRALKEDPSSQTAGSEQAASRACGADPFRDLRELGRMLLDAQARANRRQLRINRWRMDRMAIAEEEQRRSRAAEMTPFQRVRHVFLHRVYIDAPDVLPESIVSDLLNVAAGHWEMRNHVAWHNLKNGLAFEFKVELSDEQVRSWVTVQQIVDCFAPAGNAATAAPEAPAPEPQEA